jgi:hypothetical protein
MNPTGSQQISCIFRVNFASQQDTFKEAFLNNWLA